MNDNMRTRTPGEHLAFLIATFVAAAGILYALALLAQGLINIFETFGRLV
jgi:hypothetical protein